MAQQAAIAVDNSFINGVVTEATAFNFPEKACTEAYDCIFDIDGSVYRRTGFDFETNHSTKTINRDDRAIKTYLWQNVAGDGNTTVVVVQVGNTLYFYETSGTGLFSGGAQATTVTLTPAAGSPALDAIEVQFCDGNGYLIVTHPYMDPIRVAYDASAHTASATTITLKIRDFEGAVADPNAVDTRPTSTLAGLNTSHYYNLLNQGWNVTNLTAWDAAQTTMPSNADVMWTFKNTADNFDASTATIARITTGNTPAAKGHFILNLANQDRNTASGLTGVASSGTAIYRPSTAAFFAGRVFYSGINYTGYNSKLYFTQIIEDMTQYGSCYQENDPASEELFDLLPSDGGVLSIPEAGTIYKLFTIPGGLCIFAANGVWYLTGSTGIGFTASDYVLLKVADISTISDTSFVNINGYPTWWNSEGIYLLEAGQNGPMIKSLTYDTFKGFFDSIPVSSKRYARGFFDKTDGIVRWLYRSTTTNSVDETYEYDRILNYNFRTNAFYPWTISASNVKVHSLISTELVSRPINLNTVIDSGGNFVIDSSGNQVISFSASGSEDQQFDKYLVSYAESGSYKFTFANRHDGLYRDWDVYEPVGVDYGGYFIAGYKLPGAGLRKAQTNYIEIYSRVDDPVGYKFQGLWDFANTSDTNRWSSLQTVTHDDTDYGSARRRLKVRGHGKALQYKVSAIPDQPFDIIGWSAGQTINGVP